MLYCVTDIGSNTVKMNIFDRSDDGGMNLVYAVSSTLGLAGHRSDGALADRGVELLTALLLKYRKDAEHTAATSSMPLRPRACATSAIQIKCANVYSAGPECI